MFDVPSDVHFLAARLENFISYSDESSSDGGLADI